MCAASCDLRPFSTTATHLARISLLGDRAQRALDVARRNGIANAGVRQWQVAAEDIYIAVKYEKKRRS